MIFATHADGKVFYASHEWHEMTGQSRAGALQRGWIETVHPEDQEQTQAILDAAIRTQSAFSIRCRLRRADGRYAWVVAGAVPSFGVARREFIGFMGSLAEIAVSHTDEIRVYGTVEGLVLPPLPDVSSASMLDRIADHLLIVRALLGEDGNAALRQWIELGLYMVGHKFVAGPKKRPPNDAR